MIHDVIRLAVGWIVLLFTASAALSLSGHVGGLVLFRSRHKNDVRRLEEEPDSTLWGRFGFWDSRNSQADVLISASAVRTRHLIGRWFMRPATLLFGLLLLIAIPTMVAMFATDFAG